MRPEFLAALLAYKDKGVQPWHTPGHKQGRGAPTALHELLGAALAVDLSDVLEDPALDHSWDAHLQRAEQKAARLYGAAWSKFLVNGTSGGIHAALLGLTGPGDIVALPRTSHLSVVAGLALSGARPLYIPARSAAQWQLPLPPIPADYKQALAGAKVKLALVTSPNYYGIAADLPGILAEVRAHKAFSLVDEAHGAHFKFHPNFPMAATACGADVVVQSTHKTLSALTQGAILHVNASIPVAPIAQALDILGTTSPSSLILASLDAACAQMANSGQRLWQVAIETAEQARTQINALDGWHCLGEEELDQLGYKWDPCRLIFGREGLSGLTVASQLRRQFHIQMEMADQRWVVALCGLGDDAAQVKRLLTALASNYWHQLPHSAPLKQRELPLPPLVLTPRQVFGEPTERVPWTKAHNRVAAETICPYPPGVPVLAAGELITAEVLDYLQWARAAGFALRGDKMDGCIAVVAASTTNRSGLL